VSARSIVGIVNAGGNRPLGLRPYLLDGRFTVKTKLFAQMGRIGLLSVGLLAGTTAAPNTSNSFSAVLTGDVNVKISGSATFGRVAGGPTAPDVFTLSLGGDSSQSAVLFTQPNSRSLKVGSYHVSDSGVSDGNMEALVMVGSSEASQGLFRASAGTLTIASVSDYAITGLFFLKATRFPGSGPGDEDQSVDVSGSFSAERSL
jgi:hypothetical protein